MSSNPENDPDIQKFIEFTSRNDGLIPSVAESNRKRETKYRLGVLAAICVLLWLGGKLIKLQSKLTAPVRTPVNINNLTPSQQEALLRLHGIDNGDSSDGKQNPKQDDMDK